MLLSLTYVSSATRLLEESQLEEMLAKVRPLNQAQDVTGMLLYSGGNIMQTLEGPDQAVRATYQRITRDRRHVGLILMYEEEIAERRFPDWSMGFHRVGSDPTAPDGYSAYLNRGTDALEASEEPVHRLLRIFKDTMRR